MDGEHEGPQLGVQPALFSASIAAEKSFVAALFGSSTYEVQPHSSVTVPVHCPLAPRVQALAALRLSFTSASSASQPAPSTLPSGAPPPLPPLPPVPPVPPSGPASALVAPIVQSYTQPLAAANGERRSRIEKEARAIP